MLFLVTLPVCVNAEVSFSEIMYDLDGSDTGREWIEVTNSGSDAADISLWKLFENNTNHALVYISGGQSIVAGGYAIIADNKEKFLTDWPSFTGPLFESSFSLNNTGETMSLKDPNGSVMDTVTYFSELGAVGDGKSLQKVNGTWKASTPTVGAQNVGSEGLGGSTTSSTTTSTAQTTSSESSGSSASFPVEPQIFTEIHGNSTAFVGADLFLKGHTIGLEKKPIENARYIWNFGDGGSAEGETVSHVYRYPGEYIIMLAASSGKYSATDRMQVKVIPADVVIAEVVPGIDGYVVVGNNMSVEIDLSQWVLRTDKDVFLFPKNTIVLGKNKIILSPKTTGLIAETLMADLLYPNGSIAYHFPSTTFQVKHTVVTPAKVEASTPLRQHVATPQAKKVVVPTLENKVMGTSTVAIEDTAHAATFDAVINDESTSRVPLYVWMLGLVVVIGGSAGGAYYFRKTRKDDITIVE